MPPVPGGWDTRKLYVNSYSHRAFYGVLGGGRLYCLIGAGNMFEKFFRRRYNPVFDSCWKKKSLYPLYLLGCSDFYRCFEL